MKHLRYGDYFAIIAFCSHSISGRSAVQLNIANERFTVGCLRYRENLKLEISLCHLADYAKELCLSACRTSSTIILPRSTKAWNSLPISVIPES